MRKSVVLALCAVGLMAGLFYVRKGILFCIAIIAVELPYRATYSILQTLHDAGLNINAQGGDGDTLLHHAMTVQKIKWLLDKGASPNIVDDRGDTPLIKLSRMDQYWRDISMAKALIDGGADVNIRNNQGETALHFIAGMKLFTANEESSRNAHQAIVDYIKLYLNHGADQNVKDKAGNTPLMNAIWAENTETIKLLEQASLCQTKVISSAFYQSD